MKGYKAFDKDLKCRGIQFIVGNIYFHDGTIKPCESDFHFCAQLKDIYNYYPKNYDTRICEVEALGEVLTEGDKSYAPSLKIIQELSRDEIKLLTDDLKFNSGYRNSGHHNSGNYNPGHYNSGYHNSGNYNSGYCNSGNYNSGNSNSGHHNSGNYNWGNSNSGNSNSGYRNSGDYNSGYCNSGYYNSGHHNPGDYNSGNYNSGHYNSGNYNSGDYNSGYNNSGFFNTFTPYITMFNKKTKLRWDDGRISKLRDLNVKPILQWVYESSMTDQEKSDNPSYKTTGGFLKNTGKQDWSKLTDYDKKLILSLPGYDDEIFKQITGISLLEEK